MSLFDVPLHFAFYRASVDREHIDFAHMLDGAFVTADPVHAVTFVENHDTQPNQALESTVGHWFKPAAYALVLLREAGYPCVFFADLYGLPNDAIPAVAAAVIAFGQAHSGQFVSLYTNDASRLLPRPISICETDKKQGSIRLVYRTAGEGTRQFSCMKKGDSIKVLGPIGNGYDLDTGRPVLMGGGIGIPPMLQLASELSSKGLSKDKITVILGYREEAFLLNEFRKLATVYISSDTGSVGIKGNVIDAAGEYAISGDMIYACGPKPMLRAVKAYAYERDVLQ